jgi:hypothetical protein
MADNVSFFAALRRQDWLPELSGWNCSALRIPGATVNRILVDGVVVDSKNYQVEPHNHLVRWAAHDRPPATAIAELVLQRSLNSQFTTIVITAVTSIVTAIISAVATYFSAK